MDIFGALPSLPYEERIKIIKKSIVISPQIPAQYYSTHTQALVRVLEFVQVERLVNFQGFGWQG